MITAYFIKSQNKLDYHLSSSVDYDGSLSHDLFTSKSLSKSLSCSNSDEIEFEKEYGTKLISRPHENRDKLVIKV